jgi:hypothetical protein
MAALSTHWTGDWVDLRDGVEVVVKRKILAPAGK